MTAPEFWKTSLEDVEAACRAARRAEKRVLTESAGGRPVYMLAYGPGKACPGRANYSSALGAHDRTCYKDPSDVRTMILIGAEHGQEKIGRAHV